MVIIYAKCERYVMVWRPREEKGTVGVGVGN